MSKRTLEVTQKELAKTRVPRKKKKQTFAQQIENIKKEITLAKTVEYYGKLGLSFLAKCFYLQELLEVKDLVLLIMRLVFESGKIVIRTTENAYWTTTWGTMESNRYYNFITVSQAVIKQNELYGIEWKIIKKKKEEDARRQAKDPGSYSFLYKRPQPGPTCFIITPKNSSHYLFPGFPKEEEFKKVSRSLVPGIVDSILLFETEDFNSLQLDMNRNNNYRLCDLENAQRSLFRQRHKMGQCIADIACLSQCDVLPVYTHM
jgi:hypothetical protein